MSPELPTERLLLRPLQSCDAPALLAIFSDPETVAYTEWDPFETIEDAHWLIRWANTAAEQEPRTVFAWAIQWRDSNDDELLGIVTLTIRNPSGREADIGYMVNRTQWGRGIASEAVQAIILSGFHDLALHRIVGRCSPENTASGRVLEKVGMLREGCLRRNTWEKGRWRDTLIYALLEDEVPGAYPSLSGVSNPPSRPDRVCG